MKITISNDLKQEILMIKVKKNGERVLMVESTTLRQGFLELKVKKKTSVYVKSRSLLLIILI